MPSCNYSQFRSEIKRARNKSRSAKAAAEAEIEFRNEEAKMNELQDQLERLDKTLAAMAAPVKFRVKYFATAPDARWEVCQCLLPGGSGLLAFTGSAWLWRWPASRLWWRGTRSGSAAGADRFSVVVGVCGDGWGRVSGGGVVPSSIRAREQKRTSGDSASYGG